MRRTLILGLDNPHSSDPRAALLPRPKGSTGHRLFVLSGLPWSVYREAFERRNVRDGTTAAFLSNRTVIVLGREAWRILGLSRVDFFKSHWSSEINATFVLVPHPSGLNRFYNRADNRRRIEALLRREANR
jgi:hypothetical protein